MASRAAALSSDGLYPRLAKPSKEVRNLAMGILVQAVRDIIPKSSRSDEWKSWRADALEWFMSDHEEPGSFVWVTEILNVTPMRIRSWLRVFLRSDRERQVKMASRLIHFRVTR